MPYTCSYVWFTLLRTLAIAALVGGGASFSQSATVNRLPVTVWRGAPMGRGVEFCLPLAQGELFEAGAIRAVNDQGQELPLQTRVLSFWPQDKSLRVVWLTVASDARPFAVEYGKGVRRKTPATKLTIEEKRDALTVSTGPLRFRVSSNELRLLEQVWFDKDGDRQFTDDEAVLVAPGAVPVLTTIEGRKYVPAPAAPEVVIEDRGPLYVTVRIRGELVPEDKQNHAAPEERFQLTCRIKAWAGSPALSVQHALARTGRPFALDPPPDDNEQRREWSLLVPIRNYGIDFTLKTAGRTDYCAGGDNTVVDRGTLPAAEGRLLLASGQYQKAAPDVRFEVESRARVSGPLRWLDVSGEAIGMALAIRDAAELFPKAYEVRGTGRLAVSLWHDDAPRAVLEIGSGFRRIHDIVLEFHQGPPETSHGERAASLTTPPRAGVSAEQFRRSRVFGLMPGSLEPFPELVELLGKLTKKLPVRYGEHIYGNPYWRSPDERGRDSQNSGHGGNPIVVYGDLYAALGTWEHLDAIDSVGRWQRDWYAKHRRLCDGRSIAQFAEPSNTLILLFAAPLSAAKRAKAVESTMFFNETFRQGPRQLGCVGLTLDCRVNPCFVKGVACEGLLYHYYLTGDPESRATAAAFADFYHELLANPKWYGDPKCWIYDGGDRHRFHLLGPWMNRMAFFYEGLGDEKYLERLKFVMTSIMKGAHADFPDDDYIFNRMWIANAPWTPKGNQRFARATCDYLRLTRDDSVKAYAAKLADSMIKNYWDETRRGFYYRPAMPRDLSKGWVPLTRDMTDWDESQRIDPGLADLTNASTLVWCYQTTGNEEYVEIARRVYERVVDRVRSSQYNKKGEFWTYGIDSLLEDFWNYYYVIEQRKAGP